MECSPVPQRPTAITVRMRIQPARAGRVFLPNDLQRQALQIPFYPSNRIQWRGISNKSCLPLNSMAEGLLEASMGIPDFLHERCAGTLEVSKMVRSIPVVDEVRCMGAYLIYNDSKAISIDNRTYVCASSCKDW